MLSNCGNNNNVENGDNEPISRAPQNPVLLLEFVNHYMTNYDVLKYSAGLTTTQSDNIYNYKKGNDGVYGTSDDNLFDSVNELDDVPYIGQAAIDLLDTYAITVWQNESNKIHKYIYTLNFLNHRTLEYKPLNEKMSLDQDVALGMYYFRTSNDSYCGTTDDNFFNNIKDIDDISGVGEVTLNSILNYCNKRNLQGSKKTYLSELNFDSDTNNLFFKSIIDLNTGTTKNNILVNSDISLKISDTEIFSSNLSWDTTNDNYWNISETNGSIDTAFITWLSDNIRGYLTFSLNFSINNLNENVFDTYNQKLNIRFRLGNDPLLVFDKIGDDEYWISEQRNINNDTINIWKYEKIGDFPNAYDFDNDGLADNIEEPDMNSVYSDTETDRFRMDSDGDGFSDYYETMILKTNPRNQDSDLDSLSDTLEILVYKTNPMCDDTDGDSLSDGFEVKYNLNSLSTDSDSDGILDWQEDDDYDNRNNFQEAKFNTNANQIDTDTDGEACLLSLKEVYRLDKRRSEMYPISFEKKLAIRILPTEVYKYKIKNTQSSILKITVTDIGPVNDAFSLSAENNYDAKVTTISDRIIEIIMSGVTSNSILNISGDGENTPTTPGPDVTISAARVLNSVTISSLNRVAVYNSSSENTEEVTVTLLPTQLPEGINITVKLSTSSGNGFATFDDGSTSKTINKTTVFSIKGVANSDVADNIKISAKVGEIEEANEKFSVRTWPINCNSTFIYGNLYYGLKVELTWESESGNISDLSGIQITEEIEYNGMTNPPFLSADSYPDGRKERLPTEPIWGTKGVAVDTHRYSGDLISDNVIASSYTVTQEYQFKDTVLGTDWELISKGNYSITYEIYSDSGNYKFKTTKSGEGGPFVSDEDIPGI